MRREFIGPLFVGLLGVVALLILGFWQVERLHWKRAGLAVIEARIGGVAVSLPSVVDVVRDRYLPVEVQGVIGPGEIDVLASRKLTGAGYRVIVPFSIGQRQVLLDRGFIATEDKSIVRPQKTLTVVGNLHWPDEVDRYTPAPDIPANIWFARDVAAMAEVLGTEPVLIVAKSDTGDGIEPFPVGTAGIPNDHLQYAITWFSLAAVWFGMTALLLWRIKRRTAINRDL